jgi:hypothetical protein
MGNACGDGVVKLECGDGRGAQRADHVPGLGGLCPKAGTRRDHRWAAVMDGVDDLARVDSLEGDRGDPEVRVLDMRVIYGSPCGDRAADSVGGCSAWGSGYAVGAKRRSA